ncbi:MAG: ribonuclease III [Gammaproteobacteria bacterium]|nr:MAG: ribonuclease III [Gammaproteobacteria bacterium]
MTSAADQVAAVTGYRFRDESLLAQALTHRSANTRRHNERLEFLGDALLGFLIADRLYHVRSDDDEGDLSRLRASLVRGITLAEIAADLELGRCLTLGSGELRSGGHRRRSILADALEAILGAIYLDGGLEPARAVVERLFAGRMDALPDAAHLKDPKTRLQEWLQARGLALPRYELVDITGEEHAQHFTVRCRLEQPSLSATGEGSGRRHAEQSAALAVLETLERGEP